MTLLNDIVYSTCIVHVQVFFFRIIIFISQVSIYAFMHILEKLFASFRIFHYNIPKFVKKNMCIYIYIYIHMCVCVYMGYNMDYYLNEVHINK